MTEDEQERRGWWRAPDYRLERSTFRGWVAAGCLTALVILALMAARFEINPRSIPALALHNMGINIFEPDYISRSYGLQLHYGLMSYRSVSEIVWEFQRKGIAFEPAGIASPNLARTGNKPPFMVQEISCPAYPIGHGKTVSLDLLFFNDRLMRTRASGSFKHDQRLTDEFNAYLARYS
jgi:hypothetical protein